MLQIMFAFSACFCFGILFHVNKEHLIYAALGGSIGYAMYELLLSIQLGHASALFLATCSFAIYSEVMARVRKTTVTTFSIIALIPFVPGGGMYLTMLAVVNDELFKAIDLGVSTIADACILALGIIFVATLSKLIQSRVNKF